MSRWIIIFILISVKSVAQKKELFEPDSIKRIIRGIDIDTDLKIDGKLDENEWMLAEPVSDFIQIEPDQGAKANHKTTLSVLYNDQFLYFGIFARDSLGKKAIRATDFKRDFDFKQHDLITIAIDCFNDKRNSMAFVTNPYGVQRDLLGYDDIYYNLDWDGLWNVRSTRTDSGWIAELAIPWKTLRYPRTYNQVQNWGFNIYRNRRLTNEISAFSPFPRSVSILRMAYAGILSDLRPPPPKSNIRIQPYLLSSLNTFKDIENNGYIRNNKYKFGGELKWAINSNAVLDLTFNTDFAQADVDRQVNNLTRFNIFFPEKRSFFLENASLFSISGSSQSDETGGNMKIQPFFSRRIGLGIDGSPIPIDAGARYVYRSAKNNYGLIAMRQRSYEDSPAINFFIGRYAKNFGRQSRIGGLFLMKNSKKYNHITSTIDGFFRFGQANSINALFVHTLSGLEHRTGYSAFGQYFYSTNKWKVWWTQSIVSKKFNPEMGFVSRKDIIGTTPGVIWKYRGNKLFLKKYIRAYEPSVDLELYHNYSTGKILERQLRIRPVYFNFQSGAYLGYDLQIINQNLINKFSPLGITISPGNYFYIRHQILASSDPSKILNFIADINWGKFFNGGLQSYEFAVHLNPIPHISLQGGINRNNFKNVGSDSVTKVIDLLSLSGRFALNPRIQMVSFVQKNEENNSFNFNIRFSWEYKPLSFIYIVFNRVDSEDSQHVDHLENYLITKISFLRQL